MAAKFIRDWLKKDYRLLVLLAVFYTLFDLISISKQLLLYQLRPDRVLKPNLTEIFHQYFIDWLVVIGFMSIIAFTTYVFISNRITWLKIGILHFTLSLLIGFAIRIVGDLFGALLGTVDLKELTTEDMIFNTLLLMDYKFLVYFSMLFIIYAYYYFIEYEKNQARKVFLERQAARDRIKMLSTQLQPHFLFNTLNCISSLISFDRASAQKTLMDLSNFFRAILKEQDQQIIRVKQEMETLQYYMDILSVRFTEQLRTQIKVDPEALQVQMPALLIQPLVENSIKHGFSYDHNELMIKISVSCKNERLIITVENDGSQLDKDSGFGTGLGNIRERLEALYPNEFVFLLENKKDQGVINRIEIPISEQTWS